MLCGIVPVRIANIRILLYNPNTNDNKKADFLSGGHEWMKARHKKSPGVVPELYNENMRIVTSEKNGLAKFRGRFKEPTFQTARKQAA